MKTRLFAYLSPYIDRLSSRERLLLGAGAVMVGLALVYLLIYSPFSKGLAHYRAEVPKKKQTLAWMREASRQVKSLKASGPKDPGSAHNGSSLAVLDRTAKLWHLDNSVKKMEPDRNKGVTVWLEEAIFDDILKWCYQLREAHGIHVSAFRAESRNAPGYVTAKITFTGSK